MIGIAGYGIVGKATESALNKEVKKYDPVKGYNDDLSGCSIIFICINEKDSKMANLNNLVKYLTDQNKKCFFVIRTTVIPFTIKTLIEKYKRDFVFMPEFLTERKAEYDALHPDKIIIGTEKEGLFEIVKTLFKHLVADDKILKVKPEEAELAKIAINSFATMKVIFAEELYDLTQKMGIEYNQLFKIFELETNIESNHLTPWKDGYRGADGKCLPKDSKFFLDTANEWGVPMLVMSLVKYLNNEYLKTKEL